VDRVQCHFCYTVEQIYRTSENNMGDR